MWDKKRHAVSVVSLGLQTFEDTQQTVKDYIHRELQGRAHRFQPCGGSEDGQYVKRVQPRMGRETDTDKLTRSIKAMYPEYNQSEMIFADCRFVSDQDRDKSLGAHVGTHPRTLHQVISNTKWGDMMMEIHQSLHKCSDNEIVIVFICNKGKHRSEASRWAMQQILINNGYTLCSRSLSSFRWSEFGCQREYGIGRCTRCDIDPVGNLVNELIDDLVDIWANEDKDRAERERIANELKESLTNSFRERPTDHISARKRTPAWCDTSESSRPVAIPKKRPKTTTTTTTPGSQSSKDGKREMSEEFLATLPETICSTTLTRLMHVFDPEGDPREAIRRYGSPRAALLSQTRKFSWIQGFPIEPLLQPMIKAARDDYAKRVS